MARIAGNGQVEIDLRRSGFIDWNESTGDGQGWELVILPVLWLVNWLTHLIVFRGGWTIRVYPAQRGNARPICKLRYRTRADAVADVHRQLDLAGAPKVAPNDQ